MRDKDLVNSLRNLLQEAYTNSHSSFYRDVYSRNGFVFHPDGCRDLTEWQKIPCITKKDLTAVSYKDRMFMPAEQEDMLYFHMSSGTSKSPVVLNLRNRHFQTDLSGPKRFADRLLWVSGSPISMHHFYAFGQIASIGGDLADFPATARLAAQFAIQGIHATPSQLIVLTPHLKREMDLTTISLLILWGERMSALARSAIRSHYPNATVFLMFGNAETQGFHAITCEELARSGRNCVHFLEDAVYPELVNVGTGAFVNTEATEGELVVTILRHDNMFPVIRFRTGDLAQRVRGLCSCGRESFEIVGRSGFDRLTIPGGQLKSEEIERVMSEFSDDIYDDYSVHVFDIASRGSVRPRFELHVRPRTGHVDVEAIAARVAAELFVGPEMTVASGVAAGMYEQLICKKISDVMNPASKKTRIVRHV